MEKKRNIASTPNEKLISSFMGTKFNEKYFSTCDVTNIREAVEVNKALQTVIAKGKGDSLRVTIIRIMRKYGEWHINDSGNKDSLFVNTNKMKNTVKETIVETSYRLQHKDNKSLDYKIISGLTRIKR